MANQQSDVMCVTVSPKHFTKVQTPIICREKRITHIHLQTWGTQARFYIDTEHTDITDEVFDLLNKTVWHTISKHRPRRGLRGGARRFHTYARLPMELVQEVIAVVEMILRSHKTGKKEGGL